MSERLKWFTACIHSLLVYGAGNGVFLSNVIKNTSFIITEKTYLPVSSRTKLFKVVLQYKNAIASAQIYQNSYKKEYFVI